MVVEPFDHFDCGVDDDSNFRIHLIIIHKHQWNLNRYQANVSACMNKIKWHLMSPTFCQQCPGVLLSKIQPTLSFISGSISSSTNGLEAKFVFQIIELAFHFDKKVGSCLSKC